MAKSQKRTSVRRGANSSLWNKFDNCARYRASLDNRNTAMSILSGRKSPSQTRTDQTQTIAEGRLQHRRQVA
jgi:hypothetical protein